MFWPFLRKLLPALLGLAAAGVLLMQWYTPLMSLALFPGWVVLMALGFIIISGHEARRPTFWFLLLPPTAAVFGAVTYSLLAEGRLVRMIVAVLVSVLVWLYMYTHTLFIRQPARYQPYALEHLSLVMNLLSAFLVSASFVGYVIFLSIPTWTASVGTFGVGGLLLAETLWVSKVRGDRLAGLVFFGSLFLAEAAAVLLFLPVSFVVSGTLLAVAYYVVAGLLRAHALEKCDRTVITRYTVVALCSIVLVLSTARWV